MTIEIWDKINKNNIRIIGVSASQEGNLYEEATVKEIIAEKFLN